MPSERMSDEARGCCEDVLDAVLAEWPERFAGGMVEFDNAYFDAIRAGATGAEAGAKGGMALLEVFVQRVKDRLAGPA